MGPARFRALSARPVTGSMAVNSRLSRPALCLSFSSSARLATQSQPPSPPPHNPNKPPSSTPSHQTDADKARAGAENNSSQWFRQEEGAPKRPSFNALLFQSTAMRVRKDREEQKRFAELREAEQARRSGPQSQYRTGVMVSVFTLLAAWLGYRLGSFDANAATRDLSTLPLQLTRAPKLVTDQHSLRAVWGELCEIVGKENVSTAEADLASHATSDWQTWQPRTPEGGRPFLIVRPSTTEEVSEIMKQCHSRRIPVVVFAGGTSLEGHFTANRGGVCIDLIRMDKVVKLHKDDLDVVVQPGVGWEGLNDMLGSDGLFFPPDPGPGALIGGMIATGCSGTNAYHYGTIRDWVLGMTVVLADGTIVKTRQRPRKSSSGYDLTRLFIGSEGTLGIVTEATLKLTPKPANLAVAVCPFPSIADAVECVSSIVQTGISVAAVELLDDAQMRSINQANVTTRKWPEKPTLFFKFAGPSKSSTQEQISMVQKIAKQHGLEPKSFLFAKNDSEVEELWSARKEALWSMMGSHESATTATTSGDASDTTKPKPKYRLWLTDVAVPISKLPTIITESKKALEERNLTGTIIGHVGDGNFHAMIRYRADDKAEAEVVEGVVHDMVRRAIQLGGTASGEHGVGLGKRDFVVEELGDGAVDLMRKIKLAVDPLGILNCDKVIRIDKDLEE